MAERVKVCNCDKCGNEAEMTVTCKEIDVKELSGEKKKMQETMVCKTCGNVSTKITDFGPNIME